MTETTGWVHPHEPGQDPRYRTRWTRYSEHKCPQCGEEGTLVDGRIGDDVFGWCEAPVCGFEY